MPVIPAARAKLSSTAGIQKNERGTAAHIMDPGCFSKPAACLQDDIEEASMTQKRNMILYFQE